MSETPNGLPPEVRDAALAVLSESTLAFLQQEPLDSTMVVTKGDGGYAISRAMIRGQQTANAFAKAVVRCDGYAKFAGMVSMHAPELVGHMTVGNSCAPIGDFAYLLAYWSSRVARNVEAGQHVVRAASHLLDQVDGVLRNRRILVQRMSFVSGLTLPDTVPAVPLAVDLTLRRITPDDRARLRFASDSRDAAMEEADTTVMVFAEEEVPCEFTIEATGNMQGSPPHTVAPTHAESVVGGLHVVNAGCTAILFTAVLLLPDIFPPMGERGRSAPPSTKKRKGMDLTEAEAEVLSGVVVSLAQNRSQKINVAAGRLVESANRLSPVDALVDAMIGIDVLLDPTERTELSFRAALNYAFLGPREDRSARFHSLKKLQNVRGKVLHAGVNMSREKNDELVQAATDARICLRDILLRFLTDESLEGKKDNAFWMNRIFDG